jgi:hypothetical protein
MAKNATSEYLSSELVIRLAEEFGKIVTEEFSEEGTIPAIKIITSACALLLSNHAIHLPPSDRALMLGDLVREIVEKYELDEELQREDLEFLQTTRADHIPPSDRASMIAALRKSLRMR